jgi:chromosomal replication initiator protein
MDRDINKIWKNVLDALRLSVSEGIFNTYLKPTQLISITPVGDDRLICEINCSSAFIKGTLEKRYWGQIALELKRITQKECELVLKVEERRGERVEASEVGPLFEEKKISEDAFRKTKLKTHLTFDNYAVGGSNQMAFAAASAVAKNLGHAYNPLFIYGGVGVGKTHLMQAIGHATLSRGEDRVLFCTGEEFTNDLVGGIQNKNTEKVRSKYRKVKLLMIDDVQFIAGKASVQEEFFHTFNSLTDEGAQIVMTSDRPPSEIARLEERLKSRFGAGMIVDVGPADMELRAAILLIKSKQKGMHLPIELAQMAADNIEGLRELEGFLIKLGSEIALRNVPMSEELVKSLLKLPSTSNNHNKIITPNEVINTVSNYYGVGVQLLKGDRRTKHIVMPRQILMYLLRFDLRLPLEEVGRLIGGRDHTTVMHASEKIARLLDEDVAIKNQLGDLKRKLLI